MSSGLDHYREAESLLEQDSEYPDERIRKRALVHAMLAMASAAGTAGCSHTSSAWEQETGEASDPED